MKECAHRMIVFYEGGSRCDTCGRPLGPQLRPIDMMEFNRLNAMGRE